MNLVEAAYGFLGVRREYQTNLASTAILVGISELYGLRIPPFKKGVKTIGSTPADGSILYVYNHLDSKDPFRMLHASLHIAKDREGNSTRGRIPRALAKSTLFGIPEPREVQERTGKEDIFNTRHSFRQSLVRRMVDGLKKTLVGKLIGGLLSANGAIVIVRGTDDSAARTKINEALNMNQAVVYPLNETRDKTGALSGIKRGAALVVKSRPDMPFQLVAISKDRVAVSEPQTYNEIRERMGHNLNLHQLTMLMAERLIALQPESIQERWRAGEREATLQSLFHK